MGTAKQTGIRCFVAVELPDRIQTDLQGIQTALQPLVHKASWVKPGNVHLTLKFLGDIRPESTDAIQAALEQGTEKHSPFSMDIGGIGAFPNLKRPRVLWIGIKQGSATVARLADAVNRALMPLGFSTDTRFHPHLTLARLKASTTLEPLKNILRKYDTIKSGSVRVTGVTLMQSRLHRNGARYTPLGVCHFPE